ncbi:MAG: hypothetical protein USCGTAYLOR_02610 [Chromatiales bacterium USCg_Taylor]|nr:MAG: hypothetical protein USCGTAYLOR_02610 [Chromatiales bacterium USCg_Taylor]
MSDAISRRLPPEFMQLEGLLTSTSSISMDLAMINPSLRQSVQISLVSVSSMRTAIRWTGRPSVVMVRVAAFQLPENGSVTLIRV